MCGVGGSHDWNHHCSGFANLDLAPGLQERIDEKEKKRAQYLENYDECWLVIAAQPNGNASFFEWSEELASYRFSSNFIRVFFVQGLNKTAHELQLK